MLGANGAGKSTVLRVVAGKHLVNAKKLTQMDENDLKTKALEWGAKIKAHHEKPKE